MKKFRELIEEGLYQDAIGGLEEILEGNPYNTEALIWLAKAQFKLEDYDNAITNYNTLINLIPGEADLYSDRGLCYHMAGEHDLALHDFDKAVGLEPENSYRYSCRAFIKDYYKDYQGALEDYNKAIELDPDDAIAYNNKGVLEEKMGYAEQANQSFSKSDKIQGIDLNKELLKINNTSTIPITLSDPPKHKLSLNNYLKVLRSVITTKSGFKDFFSFLKRRK